MRRLRWRAVGATVALAAGAAVGVVGGGGGQAGAVTPGTFAVVDVPSGEVMAPGYYRLTQVAVTGTNAGLVATATDAGKPTFELTIAPKEGGTLAAPQFESGTTTGPATAGAARVRIFEGPRGCDNGVGEYMLDDIAFNGGGAITRLALTWRMQCLSLPNQPISSGYVYLNQNPGPIGSPATSTFVPVTPKRVLDTRDSQALGAGGTRNVQITGGVSGVPAGASAVVVNLTAISPTTDTFLTVYPAGAARPDVSNLNPRAGDIVPNLATVKLSVGGAITLYNNVGSTHAAVDVMGYYKPDGSGKKFVGRNPQRLLDTRESTPLGPGGTRTITVDASASAAVLNVTATRPTAPGGTFVTVYPAGVTRPDTSNLNVRAGQTIPNLAVVKLNGSGQVTIYNAQGNTDVIIDVVGTFKDSGDTPTSGRFVPIDPTRVYDSRNPPRGMVKGPLGNNASRDIGVVGLAGGYPFEFSAMVANVTATNTSAQSYLTAYPTGLAVPLASNLNWLGGETRPNQVMNATDDYGFASVYNAVGQTDVIIDVAGWFTR